MVVKAYRASGRGRGIVGARSERGEERDSMCLDGVQLRAGGQEGLNCEQAASHVVPDKLLSRPTALRMW